MAAKTSWRNNVPDSSVKELKFVTLRPDVFGKGATDRIRKIVFQSSLPDAEGAGFDISSARDGSVKACLSPDGETLTIGAEGGINAADCHAFFYGLEKIKEIIFEENAFHADLSGSFSIMFCDCLSLTELDLSGLDSSKVTNFNEVFENCRKLQRVNLSGWDTSLGKEFRLMFAGCESLTELDLSGFSTEKACTFEEMFKGCKSLKTLDIRYFDTLTGGRYSKYFDKNCDSVYYKIPAKVDGMFSGCSSLENLYLGQRFEIPCNARDVYAGCRKLNSSSRRKEKPAKNISWKDNIPSASIIRLAFLKENPKVFCKVSADDIRKVVFTARLPDSKGNVWDISEKKNKSVKARLLPDRKTLIIGAEGGINASHCCKELFHWMSDLEEVIFEENAFHTDLATDFSFMFNCCNNLKALDLRGFNTAGSRNFSCMFNNCENLKTLDVSSFDTSGGRDFSDMFNDCRELEKLDVSGFDTSSAKNMMAMFFCCEKLEEFDVSGFDTANVTNFTNMFTGCSRLKKLDLRGFDTSSANQFMAMFKDCESLTELDLSSFDTSNALWFDDMFKRCSSLETLILGDKFVIPLDSRIRDMFSGCDKLDMSKLPQISEL